MNKRIKRELREWGESLLIALVLALLIRTFVIQAFKIPSGSMIPTLLVGDRIFVSKFIYGAKVPFTKARFPALRQPERGDIIVFKSPVDKKKDFIKRLIAKGGETVKIRNGDIVINEKTVEIPRVIKTTYYYNRGAYGAEDALVTVPEGMYFVLGDNSANSRDSRFWGFVPEEDVIGKALFIYWPVRRIQTLR